MAFCSSIAPASRCPVSRWGRQFCLLPRLWVALLALAILALSGCSASASLPTYSVVPPFSLTDQDNAAFDSRVLAQKVWIADFMFTTCTGPCPRMSAQMGEIQTEFASEPDLRLLSFSIDP